jgi:putative oxidoreductase
MKLDDICAAWAPRLLSVLRIISALVILQYGLTKLFGFPYSEDLSFQPAFSLYWDAAIFEFVGGTLLLIGVFTRYAAFVLSGETAAAYFIDHAPHGFFPMLNDGDLPVMFSFVFLFIAAAGAGPWSVDALLKKK